MKLLFLCFSYFFAFCSVWGQTALRPDIQVRKLATIRPNAVRIVFDSYSASLLYNTSDGNIYKLIAENGSYREELVFTAADHGVEYLMGFKIHGRFIYLAGNNGTQTPYTIGVVVRGRRNEDGSVSWHRVVVTEPYETAGDYDHMVSGLVLNENGDSLWFSNGSRGDHGEVNTRGGIHPGVRNTPLTTKVFCVPAYSNSIFLPYDSARIANSPYLYCSGDRNFFDMAFAPDGSLFALENSGDRDHNEEMNWLRKGRHYGFPWVMGETLNPLQFGGYDITKDKLLPKNSYGRGLGLFYSDTAFPPPPVGLAFTEPVLNLGPDCDKYKDTSTGMIYDASDMGSGIRSFTAHRSPLGLHFDTRFQLGGEYKGQGFMLGYSKGTDSANAFWPNNLGGPFLDPSEDLVLLKLEKDEAADNYKVHSYRIVEGFNQPVDAEQVGNKIYVIENRWAGVNPAPALYEVIFPSSKTEEELPVLYPNPCTYSCTLRLRSKEHTVHIEAYTIHGQKMTTYWDFPAIPGEQQEFQLNLIGFASGVYLLKIKNGDQESTQRLDVTYP